MKVLKVKVNVNVRLSEQTMDFVSNLLTGNSYEKPISKSEKVVKPEATKPVATEPEATKPVATKPEATKPVATKPEAAKPVATKPEATKEVKPEATNSDITIEVVRKELGEKINEFRLQIREKLVALGAKNISTVNPSDYEELYKFLQNLK